MTVHNRTRDREEPLAALGAARAASPAEAANGADAVLTCVSDTPDLEQVLLGPGGAAEGLASGRARRRLLDGLAVGDRGHCCPPRRARYRHGGPTPVSGGSEGAEKGTLTIFCGGSEADFARAGEILHALGSRITHLGPSGACAYGQGREPGDDRRHLRQRRRGHPRSHRPPAFSDAELLEALSAGAAASWVLSNRAGNMVDDTYPLGFKLALHRKDLGIALDEAAREGLPLAVSSAVAAQEDELVEACHGDEDVSAVARLPKRSAGLPA